MTALLSVLFVLFGVLGVVDAMQDDRGLAGSVISFGIALALASRPRSDTRAGVVLWLVPILCLAGLQLSGFLLLALHPFAL